MKMMVSTGSRCCCCTVTSHILLEASCHTAAASIGRRVSEGPQQLVYSLRIAAVVSTGMPAAAAEASAGSCFFGLTRRSHHKQSSAAAAAAEVSAAATGSHCRRASAGSLRIVVMKATTATAAATIGHCHIFEVIAGIYWQNFALFGKHCSLVVSDIGHRAEVGLGNHSLV